MKIALVHDWLNTRVGGSEKVLVELANLFPEADIYTLFFRSEHYRGLIDSKRVKTSYLQRWPRLLTDKPHWLLPLLPAAIERFDLSGYDVVISSSNAFSKGVITPPITRHICYCYSPMRFAWDYWPRYLDEQGFGPIRKFLATAAMSRVRLWDYYSAQRVDQWVAISKHVAGRIKKFYGANSEVIYPPAALDGLELANQKGDYFVTLSTLTPYKKVDVAIEASNSTRLPLIVIGDGFDRPRLEKLAGPQVKFVGRVDDAQRSKLLAESVGLLMPQEEDFGLVAVEALAAGTPVVAYRRGGVTEIVEDGVTGVLYDDQSPDGLAAAITKASAIKFDPHQLRFRAQRFDQKHFATAITSLVRGHHG